MDFWNLIGLILTFCGTALSFWQAYKAKSYRDEIQSDRQKIILIELIPIAKSARDECRKITTPVNKPMRGVDTQKVFHDIQTLAEKLQEYSHRLGDDFTQKKMVKNLHVLLSSYASKSEQDFRYKIADQIYAELNTIIESLTMSLERKV